MSPISSSCPPSTTTCNAYGLGGWNDLMTLFGHHLLIYFAVVAVVVLVVLKSRK